MSELRGFSLSQEELFVCLIVADLPLPLGFDDLANHVFGDLPEQYQNYVLGTAERSLIAHGLLELTEEQPVLEPMVAEWLSIISQPSQTWVILHQPAGQKQQANYIHHANNQYLFHRGQGGIHQVIALPQAREIVQAALDIIEPLELELGETLEGTLSETVFRSIASTRTIKRAEVVAQLRTGGLAPNVAEAFGQTFEQLRSISALALLKNKPESSVQQAFTLVCGEQQQWLLVPEAEGQLYVRNLDLTALVQVLHNFAHPQ